MLTPLHTHRLDEGAKALGVSLSATEIARLALYLEELLRWSKIADLIAPADPDRLIRKHFLDSLAIVPLLPAAGNVLDLGSGAGFPGLVLAIIVPTLQVALIEARRKRVNFLKTVGRTIQLANLQVYEGRAEQLATTPFLRAAFDVVVTRATWRLALFLSLAAPFVKPGGQLLAMKGPKIEQELTELSTAADGLRWSVRRRYRYVLPFGGERREVVIFDKLNAAQ
jgi:16S rRNA (guanine527-N7)-methyltransferase